MLKRKLSHDFNTDIDACIDRWKAAVKAHRAAQGRSDHFFLRYETLVEHPERTLQELTRFLGFEEAWILPPGTQPAQKLRRENEPWKSTSDDAVVKPQAPKFSSIFNEAEQRHIRRRRLPAPF